MKFEWPEWWEIDALLCDAKEKFDRETDPDAKREAIVNILRGAIDIINIYHPWAAANVAAPLYALSIAVASINKTGAIEPLLQPKPRANGRPALVSGIHLRSCSALAAELLIQDGWRGLKADRWVAERLHRAGYRKRGERGDHSAITAATVKGWRRECNEASANDLIRMFYTGLRDNLNARFDDGESKSEHIIKVMLPMVSPPIVKP